MTTVKATIRIAAETCKGCNLCTIFCPQGILVPDPGAVNANGYTPVMVSGQLPCTGCGNCYAICPDLAITVVRQQRRATGGAT